MVTLKDSVLFLKSLTYRIFGVLLCVAGVTGYAQPPQPAHSVIVKRGQALAFETVSPVDLDKIRAKQTVSLRLARALVVDNVNLLPAGTIVNAKVSHSSKCGRSTSFSLNLRSIHLPDGSRLRVNVQQQGQWPASNVPASFPLRSPQDIRAEKILVAALVPYLILVAVIESPVLVHDAFNHIRLNSCVPHHLNNLQTWTLGAVVLSDHRVAY